MAVQVGLWTNEERFEDTKSLKVVEGTFSSTSLPQQGPHMSYDSNMARAPPALNQSTILSLAQTFAHLVRKQTSDHLEKAREASDGIKRHFTANECERWEKALSGVNECHQYGNYYYNLLHGQTRDDGLNDDEAADLPADDSDEESIRDDGDYNNDSEDNDNSDNDDNSETDDNNHGYSAHGMSGLRLCEASTREVSERVQHVNDAGDNTGEVRLQPTFEDQSTSNFLLRDLIECSKFHRENRNAVVGATDHVGHDYNYHCTWCTYEMDLLDKIWDEEAERDEQNNEDAWVLYQEYQQLRAERHGDLLDDGLE